MPQRHVAQIQVQADPQPPLPTVRVRHILIQPLPGDCCVFCSYGSVRCPPKQLS